MSYEDTEEGAKTLRRAMLPNQNKWKLIILNWHAVCTVCADFSTNVLEREIQTVVCASQNGKTCV